MSGCISITSRPLKNAHLLRFAHPSSLRRAERLDDLGMQVLICGGISDSYAKVIEARRIEIVPFATGSVQEVLGAYLSGDVYRKHYRMPGCEDGHGKPFCGKD
ncbi:hypothetical protein TRIP_B350379 [uncultured Desulfatiglans sp.]|nr:hypothetical protein TRIP_B350379 [uncultured Desulfatiglans sp.]